MLDYEISPADAEALLKENKARLIDVREPWELATARIDGSLSMPMGEVTARAHHELDPEERLVVVCHRGIRSMNVTAWLRNQGFEEVQSLRGSGCFGAALLVSERVGHLIEKVIDARVLQGCAVVGDVVVAEFGADGLGF
jgi:rhodanese-related sulfurtransferase